MQTFSQSARKTFILNAYPYTLSGAIGRLPYIFLDHVAIHWTIENLVAYFKFGSQSPKRKGALGFITTYFQMTAGSVLWAAATQF